MTWGDALRLRVEKAGGLAPRAAHIARVVGKEYGSRNTYAKLYRVSDPSELTDEGDLVRAWLLIASTGEEPNEWGIPDDVLPLGLHPGILRDLLPRATLQDSRVHFTEHTEEAPIILGMSPDGRVLQSV